MDIRIGRPREVGDPTQSREGSRGWVAAEVLATRPPRRRAGGTHKDGDRRKSTASKDPANGRVLLLMVPDRLALPADLDRADYKVLVRFVKA